jgi:hypothetical protein
MRERRNQNRLMCADLINIEWREKDGTTSKAVANLEDISESGICIQTEEPLPLRSVIRVVTPKGELEGEIRYCVFRDIGYFVGVQFEPGTRWNRNWFQPMHLFDPSRMSQTV